MNKLMIIGNLTRDPERRTLQDGTPVCVFTVAVNRRRTRNGEKEQVDYFRVAAWRELGENCAKYLTKGRKVCVTGPVSANAYIGQDGQARASLEVNANEVEFLTAQGVGGMLDRTGQGFGMVSDRTDGTVLLSSSRQQEPSPGPVREAGFAPSPSPVNLSSASDYMEVEPDDLPF